MTQTMNQAIPLKGLKLDIRMRASAKANTRPRAKDTNISGTEIVSPALNMGQKELINRSNSFIAARLLF